MGPQSAHRHPIPLLPTLPSPTPSGSLPTGLTPVVVAMGQLMPDDSANAPVVQRPGPTAAASGTTRPEPWQPAQAPAGPGQVTKGGLKAVCMSLGNPASASLWDM